MLKYSSLAIVWQDSLLALAFGCPPASHEMDFVEDLVTLRDAPGKGGLSYHQAMSWLCHITLRYLPSRLGTAIAYQPLAMLADMRSIDSRLASHLTSPQLVTELRQLHEFYAFELHRNFVMSTLLRPYVSSSTPPHLEDANRSVVQERFQDSLQRSVRAYLQLRSMTGYARRSWAFIHNGLTSILLLSLMRETRHLAETRVLQDEMIASLSDSSTDLEAGILSETLGKALEALQKLKSLAERATSGYSRGPNKHGYERADVLPTSEVAGQPFASAPDQADR
jgi:hypothetical protein